MAESDPITLPSSATAEPPPTQDGATDENYWNRIEECSAKAAPTNEVRAKHFAAARRCLQLAEAQASCAAKTAPK
jgi:hypothetical protein